MAADKANTSPPGLRLGRELRRLREAAGYVGRRGVEQVSAVTKISTATIYRAEKGEGVKKERDVQALLDLYHASPERAAALVELVRQTKGPGWWAEYDIPPHLGLYLGMEQVAQEIWWFEPQLTPGLLQAEDYARTIITAGKPGPDDAETVSKIRFRMNRQTVLFRAERPPLLQVVMGEEALRRPIGGPTIQAAQLERLLEAVGLRNVSVRVVPVAVGFYRGVSTGPFEVLHFPPDSDGVVYEPPTVYAESFASGGYFDNITEVARYTTAFEDIRGCALSESDSQALIKQAAEALRA